MPRKFRIAVIVLFVIVAATTAISLWIQPASVHIADSSKAAEFTLHPRHRADRITSLHVEGRGKIDGEGEFTLILNGQPYKTERLNGPVKFTWRVDWYSPEAVVRYTPLTAKRGSMTLRYNFGSQ